MAGTLLPHMRLYALVLVGVCLSFAMVSSGTHAQQLTADDLRRAIPEKGDDLYYAPYLKWEPQKAITVYIVQNPVDPGCVSEAVTEIDEQIRLIRRDVPALAGLAKVTLVSAVPEDVGVSSLIIVLPTADAQVADRFTRLPRGYAGSFIVYVADRSMRILGGVEVWDRSNQRHLVYDFSVVTVIKTASERIMLGYHTDINAVGEILALDSCSKGAWSEQLYNILGTLNLNVPSIALRLDGKLTRSPKHFAAVRRLFLKTLYAMPSAVVEPSALRVAFAAALNEALERIERQE